MLADTGQAIWPWPGHLLAISALQLIVLFVLAALIAVARLLCAPSGRARRRCSPRGGGDPAGSSSCLTAAEVVPLSAAAALLGGAGACGWPEGPGGNTFGGGSAYAGVSLRAAGTWLDALGAAAVIAALAIGALLFPVLRRPGPSAARVRRPARPPSRGATRARRPGLHRAGGGRWVAKPRRYSAVTASASGGAPSIDPVLALAPALALAGRHHGAHAAAAAARGCPPPTGSRPGGRGLTRALASTRQFLSRQPLRQGGAALLLVMAVANRHAGARPARQLVTEPPPTRRPSRPARRAGRTWPPCCPSGTGAQASHLVSGLRWPRRPRCIVGPADVLAIDTAQVRARRCGCARTRSALPASAPFTAIAPAKGTGGNPVPGRHRASF